MWARGWASATDLLGGLGVVTSNLVQCPLSATSTEAFSLEHGGREGATKLMIVVTDGESHDGDELPGALAECEKRNITRYAIAVSCWDSASLLGQPVCSAPLPSCMPFLQGWVGRALRTAEPILPWVGCTCSP